MKTANDATLSTLTTPSDQQKLWEAAIKGDSLMIRILATQGVDLDAPNEDGLTAFMLATQHSHADAVMTILAAREAQYMKKIGAVLGGVADQAAQQKTA